METCKRTPLAATIISRQSWRRRRKGHCDSAQDQKPLPTTATPNAAANPSKFPAGLFHICTGSYDFKAAHVEVDGRLYQQATRGHRLPCSFRVTEPSTPSSAWWNSHGSSAWVDPAGAQVQELYQRPEQLPYTSALGWEYGHGELRRSPAFGDGGRSGTPSSGRRPGRRSAASARVGSGSRHLKLPPEIVGAGSVEAFSPCLGLQNRVSTWAR